MYASPGEVGHVAPSVGGRRLPDCGSRLGVADGGWMAVGVVSHGAVKVLSRGPLQRDACQPVHVIVFKALLHVGLVVFTGG